MNRYAAEQIARDRVATFADEARGGQLLRDAGTSRAPRFREARWPAASALVSFVVVVIVLAAGVAQSLSL